MKKRRLQKELESDIPLQVHGCPPIPMTVTVNFDAKTFQRLATEAIRAAMQSNTPRMVDAISRSVSVR